MLTKAILFAAALLVLDGRATVAQPTESRGSEAGDTSRHRLAMVTVNGVRVPYLDWGGSGPAVVFIPGMGGTAHVFDDFAPMFVDRFRVIGVTRIGFGESDQPERDGYDLASRVAHIRAALDALGIARATLIAHSLGGDEITAFAVAHPERTSGLVYLDAAIDHSAALKWLREFGSSYGSPPLGTRDQRATAETYREYLRGEAFEQAASVYSERQRPLMLIERQGFAAALKGARIAASPGHHYEFLRAPDATATRVREFLSSLE